VSRYKNILFLVAVLVVQIIGLAAQVRRPNPNGADEPAVRLLRLWTISLFSPPEKVIHGSGHGARSLWANYFDLRHVRDQNQQLREQVNRLQMEQASLLEDARQGQRLQALLGFKEKYISTTVPAQVIGTSGTDQSRVLYIDKGSADGLRPDMAVITPDGIVGKLKDVFGHTSQVLLISDQTSGAGVLLEQTRLRGVLRGNAIGQPQIINLLPDERIKPGEKVITSGGDQIFPRGIPVGVVEQVVPDTSNPPYVDILIKPAANLSHLEELLVITSSGDEMPAKEKQDLAQSAAAGEMAQTQQRASDILAERLPGLEESTALADSPVSAKSLQALPDPETLPRLKPPPSLHPDHYSPDATPPASTLTPGQQVTDTKYAPQPGRPAEITEEPPTTFPGKPKKPADTPDEGGTPATPPAAKPKKPATTTAAATGDDTTPAPKPKAPKPAPKPETDEPQTDAQPPAAPPQ
jgi:rod shape-determining protein MreC